MASCAVRVPVGPTRPHADVMRASLMASEKGRGGQLVDTMVMVICRGAAVSSLLRLVTYVLVKKLSV